MGTTAMECPSCHTSNPAGARFCLNCGTQLAAPRPAEGERRFVTVLFADVVGSTALGEQVDPEQVTEIMNGAFAFMNSAIAQYEGTVARLMGDAILAIFGAPKAHEDDAERAVLAGLNMQSAAENYAERVRSEYGVDFQVRVGIHSGLAVLAMVGNEVKTEYTAMGDTANVAARLQSAADPGSVLISGETERLIRGAFEVRPRGALDLKGKSLPVTTFEVVSARPRTERARGLEGLVSSIVGREREMRLLQERITAARQGEGSVIAVVGEAGLGKSRLIAEAREWMDGMTRLEGRGLSYGQTIAYYPWRQVIRQRIGAAEMDTPEVVRARLAAAAPAEDLPFLEAMLSVESDQTEQGIADLHGDQLVRGIEGAVRRLILSKSEGPLVLIFDDMHWADEASLALLATLAPLAKTEPIVWVFILRPDREARSWPVIEDLAESLGDQFTQLDLQPLTATDSQALLDNLLMIEGMPAGVRQVILEKSEGNPFFLEEVVRSLIDSGHIVHQDGRWVATEAIVDVAIPDTLAGVLASRIDRLSTETKRVVQTAAVIGRIFNYPVLSEAIAAERIGDPGPHLSTLTAEELVRERARIPELEYIFKHALTQEAAYDLLLLRRRKEYHRRVAEVLEHLYPDQVDDLAPLLAHHYVRAEEWERAADYSMKAGREAVRVYALREAAQHFDQAYRALNRLPDAPAERVIDTVLNWAQIASRFTMYEQVVERMEEVEGLARKLGDRRRLALVLNWLGNVHANAGYPSRGMPSLIEGYRLAEEEGDEMLSLVPTFASTVNLVDQNPRASLEPMDHVIELAGESDLPEIESHALATKAMALSRLGEFAAAEEALQRAHFVAQRVTAPAKLADVNAVSALVYFDMGLIDRGLQFSRTATARGLEGGVTECAVYSMYCTALGQVRKDELDDARRNLEETMKVSSDLTHPFLPQFLRGALGMVRAKALEPGGIETLEAVRDSSRAAGDPYTAAMYSQSLGEVRLESGDLAGAERDLDDALAYYRRNEMRPYLVPTLRLMARVYQAQGRDSEAAVARAEADRIDATLQLPVPHLAAPAPVS